MNEMGLRPTVYCKRPGHADCEYRIQIDIPTNNVINVEVWCTGFRYDFDNILAPAICKCEEKIASDLYQSKVGEQ